MKRPIAQESFPLPAEIPITNPSEDILGRENFVNILFEICTQGNIPRNEGFVIGLSGGWGEGKSSIINLLKYKLNEGIENSDIIYERFDPTDLRSSEDNTTLRAAFFSVLRTVAKKISFFSYLHDILSKYKNYLDKGDLGKFTIFFNNQGLRDRIEKIFKKSKVPILIVIDEIDRLEPEEVVEIFRLVRTNKFPNIRYLLCYDKSYVIDCFEQLSLKENFIAKTINYEYSVPLIDRDKINQFLLSSLATYFNQLNIPQFKMEDEWQELVNTYYEKELFRFFKTMRDAYRFLYIFKNHISTTNGYVNWRDMFILTIFETFYYDLYLDIRNHPGMYLPHEKLLRSGMYKHDMFSKNPVTNRQTHIDKILSNYEDRDNIDILKEILSLLFSEIGELFKGILKEEKSRHEGFIWDLEDYENDFTIRRIDDPDSFQNYFTIEYFTSSKLESESLILILNMKSSKEAAIIISKYTKTTKMLEELTKDLASRINKLKPSALTILMKLILRNLNKINPEKNSTDNDKYVYLLNIAAKTMLADKQSEKSLLKLFVVGLKDLSTLSSIKNPNARRFMSIQDELGIEYITRLVDNRISKLQSQEKEKSSHKNI